MDIDKRNLFVFFLLLLIGYRVTGQTNGLYIGLERSPQVSWLYTGNSALHSRIRLGDQYGLLVHYDFYKQLGIAMDAVISTQEVGLNWQETSYQLRSRYVKIPLQLNYTHLPMGPFSLVGRIGPEVTILTEASLNQNEQSNNVKAVFRDVGIGAAAYAGFRLSIVDFVSLNLGIRLDQDFSNGIKALTLDAFPLRNSRYTALALVLGVNILHYK